MTPEQLAARGLKVRELVWRQDDGGDLRSGPYAIEQPASFWLTFADEHLFPGHATEEAAMDFANAHNRARICAALEPIQEPKP